MKSESTFSAEKVHLVGIGGIGMSALAQVLHHMGREVSGSDAGECTRLPQLAAGGIAVHQGHSVAHLSSGVDCLVKTAAIGEGNPEVDEATRRGIPILSYAEALGKVAKSWNTTAVAGTHGKTTTAAMLTWILVAAHKNPAAVIGGIVPQLGGNALCGDGGPMVVEACEFNRSFLQLDPDHGIITNLGDDHLDYYGSSDHLRSAFRTFAGKVNMKGLLVTSALVARDLDLQGIVRGRLVTIGAKSTDVQVLKKAGSIAIRIPGSGETPFFKMKMPGNHNALNAAAASAVANLAYGVDLKEIALALESFEGIERRHRILRQDESVVVIDDYAHHPDEIEATLLTVREQFPGRRLVAVFQPHLADRVRRHFSGFLNALAYSDVLFLVRDYCVLGRDEADRSGANQLRDAMISLNMPHHFCKELKSCLPMIRERHQKNDVICVMGAGDVGGVSLELAKHL